MKAIRIHFFSFLCLLLIAGCVKSKVIDDIEIIMLYGFDWDTENEEYIGTAVSPLYGVSEQADTRENSSYTGSSKTIQGVSTKIQNKAPFQVETGKLISILFGEELVKNKGFKELLYGINEDPDIGRSLFPIIVNGRAEDILSRNYSLEQTLPRYIMHLFENNMKRNIPRVTLQDVNYQFTEDGMDPFMPVIQYKSPGVDIIGLGFLKEDKLVHQITNEQFFIFKILYENSEDATYEYHWEEHNLPMTIVSIHSKQKKHWVTKDKVEIIIKIDGFISESVPINLNSVKKKRELEEDIENKLEKESKELIKEFQELRTDPLRIGASAKATFRDWNKKNWEELYPSIDIKPIIKVSIKRMSFSD